MAIKLMKTTEENSEASARLLQTQWLITLILTASRGNYESGSLY